MSSSGRCRHRLRSTAIGLCALLLSGLPHAQPAALLTPLDAAHSSNLPNEAWRLELLPDQRFAATEFRLVQADGRSALRIEAKASYGNLVHRLDRSPEPGVLTWQWRVEKINALADLTRKEADDTSAKVCALFDMPIERVPFIERQLLRIARAKTGSDLPAATVCYVWDARLAAGKRIDNAFSRRVRYLVLRSGPTPAGLWFNERRDLAADFLSLFADESPTEVPRLKAIAVGADADNTGGNSLAYISAMKLEP